MEIKPSVYTEQVDRRALQSWEMAFGGQGQQYLTGGTVNAPTGYVFYAIAFLSNTTVANIGYFGNYNINVSQYNNSTFPSGFTWTVPITSIDISSGLAVGYMYKMQTGNCCPDPLALSL